MKPILSALSIVCVLCLAIGPKSLMQISAWGMMIVEYSEDSTIGDAVQETFSGTRPCSMCISLAKTPVEQPDASLGQNLLLKNLNVFMTSKDEAVGPESKCCRMAFSDKRTMYRGISYEVDTPPPKFI